MARKKKLTAFRAAKAVKELARERIGAPRPERVAEDRKKKAKAAEKHKPTLAQLLQQSDQ